ncbi:hypothetical protein [Konateibacter massiliensis]|uniref:hypothetical protein n=1 Tax=Konateibacter massiliensis TaxID=2002841 RepID=UPI000C158440|nr:hypothetical protein [Konateibacter massiliensis]
MKQSSLEHRVAMIQNIREISSNNEKTINRIHGVVGRQTAFDSEARSTKSRFKYRMLIAIFLFGIYALASVNKMEYMGVGTGEIDRMISQSLDYEEVFHQMNLPLTGITQQE